MKSAFLLFSIAVTSLAADPNLMPLPASYTPQNGRLAIDGTFRATLDGYREPRLERALDRMLHRLTLATGIPLPGGNPGANATLVVSCTAASKPVQAYGEDESYRLEVTPAGARLNAANPLGVMRGLETFLQMVDQDANGFGMNAATIEDRPRFGWRGLMLDVSRHWMPLPVVKRTIDGIAAVKMNVFHWHLSDDQGFRVESKRFPKLQQVGSDGNFYTQEQVREVIDYARERGIRVVPEFEFPGHASAMLTAYPQLGAAPGPYTIERKWGIFQPVVDPTREAVYQFVDGLIAELAPLFDDEFFHVGGDEVEGKDWEKSDAIRAFMKANNIADRHELQRYFSRRLQPIVAKYGKRMMGWDEILDPSLPKDIVIQSWRGQKSLASAVRNGYAGILSNGYYLDLGQSMAFHYGVDPINDEMKDLTGEQRSRVMGGEAAMWVELDTPENVDGHIWPATAVVAERLWSPATVRDERSMYRRMEAMNRRLEHVGLTHLAARRAMLARMAGGEPPQALMNLSEVVEPVKIYTRTDRDVFTQFSPLNRMVDTVFVDSKAGREFRWAVEDKRWDAVRRQLNTWKSASASLKPVLPQRALLKELAPVAANLGEVAGIGLEALEFVAKGQAAPAGWAAPRLAKLDAAQKPVAELLLMAVPGVRSLVNLAGGQ